MLTENHVVAFVCRHLRAHGWTIVQELTTTQHGHDVVATKGTIELRVEAKGETSDRRGSKRFGKPFDGAQVRDHVANAFYRAASMREPGRPVLVAIALPDNPPHRTRVESIRDALRTLKVGVFWVGQNGDVAVEAPWPL